MLRASVLAGANAALGSACAKVAFDDQFLVRHLLGPSVGWAGLYAARAVGVVVMLTLNALLFRFLARGMDQSNSTVQVTAIISATNFILSGALGWSLFGEAISGRWVLGAVLMIFGVFLLGSGDGGDVTEVEK